MVHQRNWVLSWFIFWLAISSFEVFAANQTELYMDFFVMGPVIVLEIQGKKISALLDTGTTSLVFTSQGMKNLTTYSKNKKECANTVYGKHCIKNFMISKLTLGDFKLNRVKAASMKHMWGDPQGNKFLKHKIGAVIGLGVLSSFNLLFNYKEHRLTLVRHGFPKGFKKNNWLKISFTLNGAIHTQTLIHGLLYDLIWDTGSIPSVMANKRQLRAYGHSRPCFESSEKMDSSEKCRVLTVIPEIAKVTLPPTDFALIDLPKNIPFDGAFGSNFFEKNLVFFDFEHLMIYVRNNDR